eukprot:877272-Rhodomonas_salina.4
MSQRANSPTPLHSYNSDRGKTALQGCGGQWAWGDQNESKGGWRASYGLSSGQWWRGRRGSPARGLHAMDKASRHCVMTDANKEGPDDKLAERAGVPTRPQTVQGRLLEWEEGITEEGGVEGDHQARQRRIQRMEGTADVATTGVEQWQLARRAGRQER